MKKLFVLCLALLTSTSFALEKQILYKGRDQYPLFPIYYYLNGSFDVTQNMDFFYQRDYWDNHRKLFRRLENPFKSIERDGGYWKFFKDEFIEKRSVPNYTLHLIGGGHDFRYLYEWYKYNKFPAPWAFAFVTNYMAHFGNEALEISQSEISSHDNISDIFFFDLAGVFLFSSDKVTQFFYDKVGLRPWHGQPTLDVERGKIFNAGLNYIARPNMFGDKIKPLVFIGMQQLGGASYQFQPGKYLTVAAGFAITNPLKKKGRLTAALFYDRDDELMWSLFLNTLDNIRARFNFYPGLLKIWKMKLGGFFGYERNDALQAGVMANLPMGFGYKSK